MTMWRRAATAAVTGVVLASALLMATPTVASAAQSNGGAKVMPLGDSITDWGSAYRGQLWERFQADGHTVDFVGSQSSGAWSLGDRDHEGHSGWRIGDIDAQIAGWLATEQPQTVLLHIGTNDIGYDDVAQAPARLSALIDKIRVGAPTADIFVATIIPRSNPITNARTQTYNAAIPGIVASKDDRVHLVDMYSALTTADLLDDGVHPNASGNTKMGNTWYEALQQVPRSLIKEGSDPGTGTVVQAESAARSGGAVFGNDHAGFTGSGFVATYGSVGSTTAFSVNSASTGARAVTVRYANGGWPTVGAKTLSLYVNGIKVKQVSLPATANWSTWADHTQTLTLNAGNNTVTYRIDSGDTGFVNLDRITVAAGAPVTTTFQAEDAARSGGAVFASDHAGFTGSGFVATYGSTGSSTAFTVNAASAGARSVTVRYANGGWPTVGAKTLSLYVNNAKVKQVSLPATANWSTWAEQTETVTLIAGNNTVTYTIDSGDTGFVNVDKVTVAAG